MLPHVARGELLRDPPDAARAARAEPVAAGADGRVLVVGDRPRTSRELQTLLRRTSSRRGPSSRAHEGRDGLRHAAGDHPAQPQSSRCSIAFCEHVARAHRPELRPAAERRVLPRSRRRAQPDVHLGIARRRRSPSRRADHRATSARCFEREQPGPRADPRRHQQRPGGGRRGAAWASRSSTWKRATAATTTACPEEINRRIIDHCEHVLLPYTERSKENLLREGIERDRIFVTGNPIFEVLEAYRERDRCAATSCARLGLEPPGYFLVTLHRAENVDDATRLRAVRRRRSRAWPTHEQCPVIVSVHPRTRRPG